MAVKYALLEQMIEELKQASLARDQIIKGLRTALKRCEKDYTELRADYRSLRSTLDNLLIARQHSQAPGLMALLQDATEVDEETEEEKAERERVQAESQELLKILREYEKDN
jgi:hypothetical protein